MDPSPTLEEMQAATRRLLAEIKALHGPEKLAKARELTAEVAAGRAVAARALPKFSPPVRPKMPAGITELRGIIWAALHAAGLDGMLTEWLEDLAEMEGREKPVGRPEFSDETVALAVELLVDSRSFGHPFLQCTDAIDLDSPVWRTGFECAPGLALQVASSSMRTAMILQLGGGREIIPAVHPPMVTSPRSMRHWLIPSEIHEYFERHGF